MSFAGGEILHGGDPLLHGIRYILAVFLFLEKGDEKDNKNEDIVRNNNGIENMRIKLEREKEEKEKEKTKEDTHNVDQTDKNRNKEIELKNVEEEEMSDIFIKSFLSCYKSDPHFIFNPIKNKDLELKTKIIVDNLNSKSSVYRTETSQSIFSFGFDFIE